MIRSLVCNVRYVCYVDMSERVKCVPTLKSIRYFLIVVIDLLLKTFNLTILHLQP